MLVLPPIQRCAFLSPWTAHSTPLACLAVSYGRHRRLGPVCATRRPGAYHQDWLEPERGVPGWASWTLRARPACAVPWRPAMAACVAWRSGIATEPQPWERSFV